MIWPWIEMTILYFFSLPLYLLPLILLHTFIHITTPRFASSSSFKFCCYANFIDEISDLDHRLPMSLQPVAGLHGSQGVHMHPLRF
jgi:hypothetical protein